MILFAISGFFALAYLYSGYVAFLKILVNFHHSSKVGANTNSAVPSVTVLITVFNEAKGIEARIQNVLACEYLQGKLEILIASDGSTDGTDDIVRGLADSRVSLFRPVERKGKTDTQNQAIATAVGEIIIFTDADTQFDPLFLKEVARVFNDPQVGGVDGHLLFLTETEDGVSRSQGFYWRQELQIRQLESELGIMAVASGACMAIRRSLFRPMQATVGEDCLIPLDVVDQGFRMVHADNALAFDRMEHDPKKEFRTRVRMTLRNWQGTWSYPHLLNPLRHPHIAFALWSHKILRWLSPLFLLMWLIGSVVVIQQGYLGMLAALPGMLFMVAALLGALRLPVPGVSLAYSFCLANAGFLVGVIRGILGSKVAVYK